MWSTEANDWIDIGQFKGDPGTTYYTHVAWASGVTLGTPPSHTPSQGQISTPNASSVTTFDVVPFTGATHMGVLIDTTSQDSTEKYCYTWQEVKGAQGDPGEDSINVIVSPPSMVIEQDINNTDNIAPGPTNVLGDFSIQVFKGTTSCSMSQVTASSSGGKILVSYSTTSGYSENVYWNPQGTTAHLYVKGIAKDSSDNYYDNGTISLTITYTDPDTYTSKTVSNISANVYVNLIGTWKETIEGDVKTEVAAKTTYTVDGTAYTVSQDLGTFVKSSTENISTISRKIDSGKNLLRGTLTATGWTRVQSTTPVVVTDNGSIQVLTPLMSPKVFLRNSKKYTVSYYSSTPYAVAIAKMNTSDTITATSVSTGETYNGLNRYKATFTSFEDSESRLDLYVTFSTTSGNVTIFHPQLEEGEDATAFDADSNEQTSQIKQTADEINLEVSGLSGDVSNLSGDVSELSDKVTATNLLPCIGWQDGNARSIDTDVEKCYISTTDDEISSPQIYLTAGTYSFSFYVDSYDWNNGDIEAYYATGSSGSGGSQFYDLASDSTDVYSSCIRVYGTFTLSTENYVSFTISTISGNSIAIYRPQVEKGNAHTAYTPCGDPVGSTGYVNVKANEVNLGIRNGLSTTGIDITYGTINLKGNKVTFSNTAGNVSGKVSIDSTAGTLKAVDGDFSGSVKATSFAIYNGNNRTFYADNNGNLITEGSASFSGTIKAKDLYHNVSIFVEGEDLSYGKYYCTETHGSYVEGNYYDTTDGYDLIKCTYDADTIVMNPDGSDRWGSSDNVLYLPNPADFVGKSVNIYINYYSGETRTPVIRSVINNTVMIRGLNFTISGGRISLVGGSGYPTYPVNSGETHITCISVETTDSAQPYKWLVVGHAV